MLGLNVFERRARQIREAMYYDAKLGRVLVIIGAVGKQ
jgi:hypothetical protein